MTRTAKLIEIVGFVTTCVGAIVFAVDGKTEQLDRRLGRLGIVLIIFGILCEFYVAIFHYY